MARSLTGLLLLALAVSTAACGRRSQEPRWLAERPEHAYPYAEDTLVGFRALAQRAGWRFPAWEKTGLLTTVHERTGLTFVLVPRGSFIMGDENGREIPKPVHRVTVPPFLVCATECTKAAWARGRDEDQRDVVGPDLPVRDLEWQAARDWCVANDLRLPSEAEWEYACRAGSSTAFCFGDDAARLGEYGWYEANSSGITHPVACLRPNAWGLFDVHGNVGEWCEDMEHDDYTGAPEDGSAWTAGEGHRVARGGGRSWFAGSTESAWRYGGHVGFRPARGLGEAAGAPSYDPPAKPESKRQRVLRLAYEMRYDWNGTLREKVGNVRSLTVRRARRPAGDPVFTTDDPAEAQRIFEMVTIDEKAIEARWVGSCACFGYCDLTFVGDRGSARLNFKHGRNMGWTRWPGEAALTNESARDLAVWIKSVDPNAPWEDWDRTRRGVVRYEKQRERSWAALPENLRNLLDPADDTEEVLAAFTNRIPDPAERAIAAFRVLGSVEGEWDDWDLLDLPLLGYVLPAVPDDAMTAAIGCVDGSDAGRLRGAARWLFAGGQPRGDASTALAAAARWSFASPWRYNRRRAILSLGERGDPLSRTLLTERLTKEYAVRPPPEHVVAGDGEEDGEGDLDRPCSDAAFAGLVLARLRVKAARPEISRRLEDGPAADRGILKEAVELLDR